MRLKRTAAILFLTAVTALAQDPDIGVSMAGLSGTPQHRVQLALELRAAWYRPAPVLLGAKDPACGDCEAARAAGLKLLLVVRNSAEAATASAPVKDTAAFQQSLRVLLERYKPDVLVVETEPDQARSFSGTSEEYGTELKLACDVAHEQKTKCANGGLSSAGTALVVTDQRWQADQYDAARFANTAEVVRARGRDGFAIIGKGLSKGKTDEEAVFTATGKYLGENRQLTNRIRDIITTTNASGADYLNFHWYELVPENLTRVADTLRQLSKLPLMSDEIGQRNDRPFETAEKLKLARESAIKPVIWAAVDGAEDRMGLVDKKGKLRSNAAAYQRMAQQPVH